MERISLMEKEARLDCDSSLDEGDDVGISLIYPGEKSLHILKIEDQKMPEISKNEVREIEEILKIEDLKMWEIHGFSKHPSGFSLDPQRGLSKHSET